MALSLEHVQETVSLRLKAMNDVRELCKKFLAPDLPSDQGQDGKGSPEYMRRLADSALAGEVVISLFNIFGVMSGSPNYSSENAVADLVFTLNTNPFWVKNDKYLMPIVNASINALVDNQELRFKPETLWARLEYHNKFMWLEILPAVVFCLYGYGKMRKISLEMKKTFEGLLR